MYKIKKLYNFSNKRQIWSLLPTENNLLIIEERDKEKKEVYFNCINIISGRRSLLQICNWKKNIGLELKQFTTIKFISTNLQNRICPDIKE